MKTGPRGIQGNCGSNETIDGTHVISVGGLINTSSLARRELESDTRRPSVVFIIHYV